MLKASGDKLSSNWLFLLLYVDIFLVSIICFFIFNQVRNIFRFRYKKQQGNRFHKQIIVLFSCVTIIPSACVFIFAVLFFNIGIENLFKAPVKGVIDNASQVASIYINDMKLTMENFVNGVGDRVVSEGVNGLSVNNDKISEILDEETSKLKIDAVVLQVIDKTHVNVLSKSAFSLSLQFEILPNEALYLPQGGIISWESDDSVIAAQNINRELGIYLIASTSIDQVVLDHKHKIKTAVLEYSNLATQRTGLKVTFMAFFAVITMLLLLVSVFVGVLFANWILKPVNKLITAAKNVASGDYNTPIATAKFKNEWDILISTFNNMISKLDQQKQQLIISNKQNAWRDIARKIAHEIKNPLTPIQLSAERLKNKYQNEITTTPEVFNSCVDTIIRQVNCIGNLVKEFSDFARMPAPQMENTDIIKLLKETVFIQSTAHKNIAFHESYKNSEFVCKIDQSQINQVMLNVIQNAINAIVENIKQTYNKNEIIGNIYIDFYNKNNKMYIVVEDDGPGFSDTSLEKAMEPYYTTREMGNGLGLAIVYKIINDHGGEIKLGKSKLLGGAKVFIEIPCIYQNINEENYGI